MKTACGTPGYVAPEVLTHENYSSQVDLWSVGVIVYILLCGFPPFYGDNDAQMFKRIKAGQYKFLAPYWDPISSDAKDFVRRMLDPNPNTRLEPADALVHPWLADGVEHRSTPSKINLHPGPNNGSAKGTGLQTGSTKSSFRAHAMKGIRPIRKVTPPSSRGSAKNKGCHIS